MWGAFWHVHVTLPKGLLQWAPEKAGTNKGGTRSETNPGRQLSGSVTARRADALAEQHLPALRTAHLRDIQGTDVTRGG